MEWIWASLFIRSAVILIAAELLRRIPRKANPDYRHRILLAAFVLLMIWPLCAALLPAIHLPLWTSLDSEGSVTVKQTIFLGGIGRRAFGPVNWPVVIWIGGALATLAPVVIGYLNVFRMARQAKLLKSGVPIEIARELCRKLAIENEPEFLIASKPVMPMTFGLRRASIMLPAECVEWTPLRWRAVLLHELAHVARRDLLAQLFANAMTALWWFQPLCWTNRWGLRRESEQACDAVVIASGMRASDYAGELLGIARNFRAGERCSAAAIAMARRGELEGRLCAILDPQFHGARRRLSLGGIAALALLTIGASAVTLTSESQTDPKGGPAMKRTLLSGLLVSAGLSAATTGRPVHTSTPVFTPQMQTKGEPVAFAQSSSPKRIRVGDDKAEANLVRKVQPVYPPAAKAAGVQGTVELDVVISAEGVPEDINVVKSPSDDLTQSSLDAVRQWRYRPTLLNGEPVEVVTDVIVNYTLAK